MNTLIAKSRTAPTEVLMEIALLTNGSEVTEGMMARTAAMVVLEERMSADEFHAFCDALDA